PVGLAREARHRARRPALMADKPPKKPFLGESDLVSELDAWDATFDALHDEPAIGNEHVMEWPAPPAETEPSVPAIAAPDPGVTFEDSGPRFDTPLVDLDEAGTLDRRSRPGGWMADPSETDFSDVGANDPPAALGPMLGNRFGDDAHFDHVTQGVDSTMEVEEDQVYTSASRPALPPV